jgi:hypothetical protein
LPGANQSKKGPAQLTEGNALWRSSLSQQPWKIGVNMKIISRKKVMKLRLFLLTLIMMLMMTGASVAGDRGIWSNFWVSNAYADDAGDCEEGKVWRDNECRDPHDDDDNDHDGDKDDDDNDGQIVYVEVPGPTVYVDVPGPEVIVEVPGETVYVDVSGPEVIVEVPVEVIVEVPGPEVIVEVPGETVYVDVPGPETTVYVDVPGPDVIVEVPGDTVFVNVPGPEVIVEVPGDTVFVNVPGPELIVEVPVEVIKEVIVEVPGDTVYVDVPGPEVIIEVPVETIVYVDVPGPEVIVEVPVIEYVDREVIVEVPVEVIVEVPGPEVIVPVDFGTPHYANHAKLAEGQGGSGCLSCHQENGYAKPATDKTLLSEWNYRYEGNALTDPTTGLIATDPVSGAQIISGGSTAVLTVGQSIMCRDCHYPHNQGGGFVPSGLQSQDQHQGCIDCH